MREGLEAEALVDRRVDGIGGLEPGRGAVLVAALQLAIERRRQRRASS
jgi:hypothetical protein